MSTASDMFGDAMRAVVTDGVEQAVAPILREHLRRADERMRELEEAAIATKAVLTEQEAQRYAGVGYDTLKSWRDDGLAHTKRGRYTYYPREALEAWLKRE